MARPRILGVLAIAAVMLAPAASAASERASTGAGTSVRVGALTVPAGFDRLARRSGRLVGVVVTDDRLRADSPTLTAGILPASGVALGLRELQGPQHRPAGTTWTGLLRFRGSLYTISFWIGRAASPRDSAALLRTLESIHRARRLDATSGAASTSR